MAVARRETGKYGDQEDRELDEFTKMWREPSEYILIMDTGHGKTVHGKTLSKNQTRYIADDGFGVAFSNWYGHGQALKIIPCSDPSAIYCTTSDYQSDDLGSIW